MATPTKKAPAKKAPAAKVEVAAAEEEVAFGVSDIADIIRVRSGKVVKTRDLRTLLRKMARDGRLQREIVAGNRERWVWTGADDPEVETIIEAYDNGELEADKKEKLDALKARKTAQRAAAKAEAEAASPDGDDEELEEE